MSQTTEHTTELSSSDSELSSVPSSRAIPSLLEATPRRRETKRKRAVNLWSYAREPIPYLEDVRTSKKDGGRRIWYCKFAGCEAYKVLSTSGARGYLRNTHSIYVDAEEPSQASKRR